MAVTSLGWVACAIFGALPFLLFGTFSTFSDAVFEAMSGLTTTGATVLSDIEAQPRGILFWRAFLHWLGGMGIIVLSLALLPSFQVGGMQLFRAEVPGPVPERLEPRVRETAKRLWVIYAGLSAAEALLLWAFGMSFFDAVTHTFATTATGGFSTASKSVEAWNSVAIEIIIIVFMFLAGANFTLHYRVLRGNLGSFRRDSEFRTYAGIAIGATFLIAINLFTNSVYDLGQSLRLSAFQVTSVLTTTGFTTADFDAWPSLSRIILFFLMFIGGSAGSTGGAVKVARIAILFKHAGSELMRVIHPRRVGVPTLSGRPVSDEVVSSVLAFIFIYVAVFVLGVLAVSAAGLDPVSSFGAVAATLGNVGPGFGLVGPAGNYGFLPDLTKWILILCMLIGRLEIYTVLGLLLPGFWRRT
jgi:trk system potassium uptake protein TrkH